MSKIYSAAPSGVAERVAHLIKLFHPDLKDAGVKIDLLSVSDDDLECEDALKVRGYPAYACIRAIEIKGRTMGRGDAEIVIDESKWMRLSDATRDAILDHELEHIELQITKKGRVKLDCAGRPKIKMRLHDVLYGHFISIAERHGKASIECPAGDADLPSDPEMLKHAPDSSLSKSLRRLTTLPDGISSMEISSGGKTVTIDKDGVRK
jgi:hypothetical protein